MWSSKFPIEMAHNGGKGSIAANNNACGSKICRCFVLVLIVLVSFLLYTCLKVMSRNEILMDRVRSYGQQMSRLKFEQTNQARALEQAKSQISMQQNKLNQEGTELMDVRRRATDYQRLVDEQKKKMEALSAELTSKEQIYIKLDQSCKQLSADLESRTHKLVESEKRAEDYMKRLKSVQPSAEACSRECQSRMQAELGRVVNIIRKLYGPDPVKELVKAGVDVSGALNAAGSSQKQDEVQDPNRKLVQGQRNKDSFKSGQYEPKDEVGNEQSNSLQEPPKPGQEQAKLSAEEPKLSQDQSKPNTEQPKSGQEQPKSGQEQPKPGQEQPQQGKELPKSEQELPKPDQEQSKLGQETPKPGQEQPKQGEEQPKQGEEQPKSGQEPPKSGQEQPKPGLEEPKQGQEQPKPGQKQPIAGQEQPKQDEEQPKPGQEQPKQGQEQPKSGQEQPKTGEEPKAGQEQPNSGQEPPKPGQEQPKPGDEKLKTSDNSSKSGKKKEEGGKAQDGDEYYEDDDDKNTKTPQGQGQPGQEPDQQKGQGQPGKEPGQLKFEKQRQDKADSGKKPVVNSNDAYEGEK